MIMKKTLLILILVLAVVLPASADRYLTFGVNDTLRVNPSLEDSTQSVMVRAHFDGRLDTWNLTMTLPQGVKLVGYSKGDDMLNIPYYNHLGEPCTCSASLYVNNNGSTVTLYSNITVPGYWDYGNDGTFDNYGTVKWEAGDYDQMFELVFKFDEIPSGASSIDISEYIASSYDQRGFTAPAATFLDVNIWLSAAYRTGDVDGDSQLNISDVTALIDLLLSGESPQNADIKNATDVNGDGDINIADVTTLIDLLLYGNA